MAEPKSTKTGASVKDFLDGITDETKRSDAKAIDRLLRKVTGAKPKMWGAAIVGYGESMVHYANGTERAWMALGFSPRAANLTLYLPELAKLGPLLKKLGPHTVGKGCLHVKRLADVDAGVLEQVIAKSFASV